LIAFNPEISSTGLSGVSNSGERLEAIFEKLVSIMNALWKELLIRPLIQNPDIREDHKSIWFGKSLFTCIIHEFFTAKALRR